MKSDTYRGGFLISYLSSVIYDPETHERAMKLVEQFEEGDTTSEVDIFEDHYIYLDGIDYYIRIPDTILNDIYFLSNYGRED